MGGNMSGIGQPQLFIKNFTDLYNEALARIKADAPGYTALLPSDPGVAVLDAALYQTAMLGERLNLLPYAALVAWVNYIGVEKKGPTAAKGTVTVVLEEALTDDFIVPICTRFMDANGIGFISTEETIISVGATQADVPVECETKGTVGNVSQYRINNIYQRLPYVKDISNAQPLDGGFDTELDADTLDRGRKIITHLWRAVTDADYEEIAGAVSGVYKAKAIDTLGEIKLYVLSEDGQPANSELINTVINFITPLRTQGVPLTVLPAGIKELTITANVKLLPGYQLLTVRSLAKAHLQSKINPNAWTWGRKLSISEILAYLEEVQGVDYVDELILPAANIRLEPYELSQITEVMLYAV